MTTKLAITRNHRKPLFQKAPLHARLTSRHAHTHHNGKSTRLGGTLISFLLLCAVGLTQSASDCGTCVAVHTSPGCSATPVENCVCDHDPACCDDTDNRLAFDDFCVQTAIEECGCPECDRVTTTNTPCDFPFTIGTVIYYDCTTVDRDDGIEWCSTRTSRGDVTEVGDCVPCGTVFTESPTEQPTELPDVLTEVPTEMTTQIPTEIPTEYIESEEQNSEEEEETDDQMLASQADDDEDSSNDLWVIGVVIGILLLLCCIFFGWRKRTKNRAKTLVINETTDETTMEHAFGAKQPAESEQELPVINGVQKEPTPPRGPPMLMSPAVEAEISHRNFGPRSYSSSYEHSGAAARRHVQRINLEISVVPKEGREV